MGIVLTCTMTVYACQSTLNAPVRSHTFVVFQRGQETVCISWLPAGGRVKLLNCPEPGVNLDLAGTVQWARANRAKVTVIGVYEIKAELFDLAVKQKAKLDSGQIFYAALDAGCQGKAVNCIHAVSDLTNVRLETGTAHGEAASGLVVRHLSGWIVKRDKAK